MGFVKKKHRDSLNEKKRYLGKNEWSAWLKIGKIQKSAHRDIEHETVIANEEEKRIETEN